MSKQIQAIRGMKDILPDELAVWQYVERKLGDVAARYGYREIRFPIVEFTQLFQRSVGEETDIVAKEMYTFADRNGDSLTLRPEGTAGCVRAGIENGLFYNQVQRLWYNGPFFRHERPQKGRYRQFHQFGIETTGMASSDIDAEVILLSARMWQELGLAQHVVLQLNTLGTVADRNKYKAKLVAYFSEHLDKLDEDSQRRLETNPLRILDSKNLAMAQVISDAPQLLKELSAESLEHFKRLCEILDNAGLKYEINPHLVRGLDYYTHTVFEWVTEELGAQGTVCAGGRYDGLIEKIGGQATPAIGFALGLERLVALLVDLQLIPDVKLNAHVYMVLVGAAAEKTGLVLAEKLRDALPELLVVVNCDGGSFKSQFKKADKSGAKLALVMGDDEVVTNKVTVKYLREDREQESVVVKELVGFLATICPTSKNL
jgi:histidyl-tRNA synthetase